MVIFKSRGKNWRFLAVNVETGEIYGGGRGCVHLSDLTRKLWRAGFRLQFQLTRVAP